jgi:hypothetical protein
VHVNFVVHFTHPDEFLLRDADNAYVPDGRGYYRWLPPVLQALKRVQRLSFVSFENQTPIIAGVNDDVVVLHILHEELRRLGVMPKYMFVCRMIEGHKAFAIPVETAWALHNEAMKGLSDTARSRLVMSTELGKVEVVGVTGGVIVFKIHRSPGSAETQGDLIVAPCNPDALWLSDYDVAEHVLALTAGPASLSLSDEAITSATDPPRNSKQLKGGAADRMSVSRRNRSSQGTVRGPLRASSAAGHCAFRPARARQSLSAYRPYAHLARPVP